MTKEETKERILVMQAYVDGKQIQVGDKEYNDWRNVFNPLWDPNLDYRVKPDCIPYRPFDNVKECYNEMLKHYPYGLIMNNGRCVQIIEVFEGTFDTCYIVTSKEGAPVTISFIDAFNSYKFADGAKFGVKDVTYTVHIDEVFALISFIKTIKETLHLDLKEAKNIADKARKETHRIDNLSKKEAEKIVAEINICGGKAFVEKN